MASKSNTFLENVLVDFSLLQLKINSNDLEVPINEILSYPSIIDKESTFLQPISINYLTEYTRMSDKTLNRLTKTE